MASSTPAIVTLINEIVGLIRDWRDPEKRRANYKLELDKKAERKIEIAEEYIHTCAQYHKKLRMYYTILQDKMPNVVSKENARSIKRIEKYIRKYEDKFRKL